MLEVTLTCFAGPHNGKVWRMQRHETLLAGRITDAQLHFPSDEPYLSRRHFLMEVHPPRCRIFDLDSRNFTYVNDKKVSNTELVDGDRIRVGNSQFVINISSDDNTDIDKLVATQIQMSLPDVNLTSDNPWTLGEHFSDLSMIGTGPIATVYRATRRNNKQLVAIKTVKTTLLVKPSSVITFLNEMRSCSYFTHENVVGWQEGGLESGQVHLVFEYIDGLNLGEVLKEHGVFPLGRAVRLLLQVLNGLEHVHSKSKLHGDLKPTNLLLSGPSGQKIIKITDFGLLYAYDRAQLNGITYLDQLGSSLAFRAPEQLMNYQTPIPATDQYAAAAILYLMLTGTFVYDFPNTAHDQLVQIITTHTVPIQERLPNLPPAFCDVVTKALSHDPQDRYSNVGEFREALRPFAATV